MHIIHFTFHYCADKLRYLSHSILSGVGCSERRRLYWLISTPSSGVPVLGIWAFAITGHTRRSYRQLRDYMGSKSAGGSWQSAACLHYWKLLALWQSGGGGGEGGCCAFCLNDSGLNGSRRLWGVYGIQSRYKINFLIRETWLIHTKSQLKHTTHCDSKPK